MGDPRKTLWDIDQAIIKVMEDFGYVQDEPGNIPHDQVRAMMRASYFYINGLSRLEVDALRQELHYKDGILREIHRKQGKAVDYRGTD